MDTLTGKYLNIYITLFMFLESVLYVRTYARSKKSYKCSSSFNLYQEKYCFIDGISFKFVIKLFPLV